uniref:Uncharacterized protein n=1 Tax=Oncorhynchus kisutch TaxID=8019 RepID=A0A8C7CVG4_ONCKI
DVQGETYCSISVLNLDVKTKSSNGVEFKTSGSSNTDTSKVNEEKWTTDHTLGTEITIEDQKSGKVKTDYKCEYVNLGVDVD